MGFFPVEQHTVANEFLFLLIECSVLLLKATLFLVVTKHEDCLLSKEISH